LLRVCAQDTGHHARPEVCGTVSGGLRALTWLQATVSPGLARECRFCVRCVSVVASVADTQDEQDDQDAMHCQKPGDYGAAADLAPNLWIQDRSRPAENSAGIIGALWPSPLALGSADMRSSPAWVQAAWAKSIVRPIPS
jgi:hypothetical protein